MLSLDFEDEISDSDSDGEGLDPSKYVRQAHIPISWF